MRPLFQGEEYVQLHTWTPTKQVASIVTNFFEQTLIAI
ncbi:MAG: hypothetical protein ACFWT6_04950 [Virgibacillus proomii]